MLVGKVFFKIIFSADEILPLTDLNMCLFHWQMCLVWSFILGDAGTMNSDTIPGKSKSIFLFSVHNLIKIAISEEVAMLAPVWLPSSERQVHAQSEKYFKFLGHFLCLMLDFFHVTFRF